MSLQLVAVSVKIVAHASGYENFRFLCLDRALLAPTEAGSDLEFKVKFLGPVVVHQQRGENRILIDLRRFALAVCREHTRADGIFYGQTQFSRAREKKIAGRGDNGKSVPSKRLHPGPFAEHVVRPGRVRPLVHK